MPTGYTFDVAEGKITDFKQFVMLCARAFGATITMRDEPLDSPILNCFVSSTHHATRLKEALARLEAVTAMSIEECAAAATKACADENEYRHAYETKRHTENARLQKMLDQARAWTPPTEDHDGLKELMIQQLRISINDSPLYGEEAPLLTADAWRQSQIKQCLADIDYHTKSNRDEIERANKSTKWVNDLRQSLMQKKDA